MRSYMCVNFWMQKLDTTQHQQENQKVYVPHGVQDSAHYIVMPFIRMRIQHTQTCEYLAIEDSK